MDGLPQAPCGKAGQRRQRASQESLHVACTATIKSRAVTAQGERVGTPFPLAGRHDVHMAR